MIYPSIHQSTLFKRQSLLVIQTKTLKKKNADSKTSVSPFMPVKFSGCKHLKIEGETKEIAYTAKLVW